MQNLTELEEKEVSGGIGNFIIGYFGNKILDAVIEQAVNTEEMYTSDNLSLPYNRL